MKEVFRRLEENSSTISDFALIKEAIDKDIELLKEVICLISLEFIER